MSLATRCPSCGTVFRVVQDQLRVSEGWVRCGRCNGVFNAAEVLFDIDSGAPVAVDLGPPGPATFAPLPPPRPPPPPRHAPAEAPAPAARPFEPAAAGSAPPASSKHPADSAPWTGGRQEPCFVVDTDADADDPWPPAGHAEQPLLRAPSRHQDDPADEIIITDHVPTASPPSQAAARSASNSGAHAAQAAAQPPALADEPAIRADFSAAATAAANHAATAAGNPAATTAASASARPSPVQALPSFLRTAERNALWRRPAMRIAAGLGVALLGIALVLQAAVLWRDTLAARWPATTPALAALCRLAGCSVQPLRRIESLAVRSSGLNRLEGSSLYRLQVVLQNRADTALMMPALDLSLNDAQGKLVARRVLQAAELGAPQAVLQAGEEMPLQALLSTGERRVDGYTLELFYP